MKRDHQAKHGTVATFYSYKGGVGRSMALANVAALLSRWGRRVLIVDWDLEAPGIEKFFQPWLDRPTGRTQGVVELIGSLSLSKPLDWRECRLTATLPGGKDVDIIPAGRDDGTYSERLRSLNWERLFATERLGNSLEALRQDWKAAYDFVLVDSRTGVTDTGGICSIHLPDILIAMFVANEQSLVGMKRVLESARLGHAQLPVDRRRLIIIPVPSRDESASEYKLAEQWRERFAKELDDFLTDWIPRDETGTRVMDYLKIPYFAYWSFGERLPVLEQDDPDNPKTLAFAYQPLARLLLSGLDWREARVGSLASEEAQKQAAETERSLLEARKMAEQAKREAEERMTKKMEERAQEREQRTAEYLQKVGRISDSWYMKSNALRQKAAMLLAVGLAGVLASAGVVGWMLMTSTRTALSYVSALASSAVALLAVFLTFLQKPGARAKIARAAAKGLEAERRLFESHGLPYGRMEAGEALVRFIDVVEGNLRRAEHRMEENEGLPFVWRTAAEQAPPLAAASPGEPVTVEQVPLQSQHRASDAARVYDVFLSYRHSPLLVDWLREFLPLFSSWLTEELGREATVFADFKDIASGLQWDEAMNGALRSAHSVLAILTPSYFQSEWCLKQWSTLEDKGRVFGILFHGEASQLPHDARSLQFVDFRKFAFTGEAFRNAPAYIEYQKAVREVASAVAALVRSTCNKSVGARVRHILFISFASEDLDEINLLRGQAKNENTDLEFNDYLLREPFDSTKAECIKRGITERIRQASVTLVYLTPNAARSRWVDWEIRESIRLGKGVVGVHPAGRPPSELPPAAIEHRIKVVPWSQEQITAAIDQASRKRPT